MNDRSRIAPKTSEVAFQLIARVNVTGGNPVEFGQDEQFKVRHVGIQYTLS